MSGLPIAGFTVTELHQTGGYQRIAVDYTRDDIRETFGTDDSSLVSVLLNALEASETTVEKLRQGISDYLQGDYPCPGAESCPHELYRWEECSECDDAHFSKLLKDNP